jgi:hypothetical protein
MKNEKNEEREEERAEKEGTRSVQVAVTSCTVRIA